MKTLKANLRAANEYSEMVQFYYYWLPPLLLTFGILLLAGDLGSVAKFQLPMTVLAFFLPSWSHQEVLQLYLTLRKVGHFLAYAVLFAAYVRAWHWHLQMPRIKAILLALAICLMVSSADEGRQMFYLSRKGQPQDVALDMSGALTAAIVLFPFLDEKDRKKS
jgi:VanZ family protein